MLSMIRYFLGILVLLSLTTRLCGQQWQLDQNAPPKVVVTGTSTLHDWTVTAAGVQGVPEVLSFNQETAENIANFAFEVPVDSMDGGRGASMNTKIYDAFKSSAHPLVTYQQNQPAKITQTGETGTFTITSTGTISMAGVEKPITVSCVGTAKNGVLLISGNHNLKMSDFNMEPPTAMFGQIKTNDDVVVSFEFRYLKQ